MAFVKKSKKIQVQETVSDVEVTSPTELIELAKKHSIETTPLDVSALTKLLKIDMQFEPMDGEDSGSLKKCKKTGIWKMKVNSLHHPNRQRFTIAHELGHYVKHATLHDEFNDKTFFRDGASNLMETEANVFAAELLMPDAEFNNFIENVSDSVEKIADHFQVSSMAVRVRAKTLGYSGHNI